MAIMPGTNADDTLSGTEGDDYFRPIRGDDTVDAGPGRDSIEIEPWSGNDTILDFSSGEDTLLINYFPTIDSVEDLTPFQRYRNDTGSTILDLSAAAGEPPGTQIVTFSQTATVQPTDIGVNTGEFYDPDYVPARPKTPPSTAPGLGSPTVKPFDPEGRLPPRPSLELTDDSEDLVQQQMSLTGSNDEVEFVGRPVDDGQIDF